MSIIDVENLLKPLEGDSPCGEDLEYDADFIAMEQALTGKPEQQFGSTVIEGEGPDWPEVQRRALSLFERTRDLRVGVALARSALAMQGWPEFSDALAVLEGLVQRYWKEVYPVLDPDDDNDPTMRVNALAALADRQATLNKLRQVPLVKSRVLGIFNLRQIQASRNEGTLSEGEAVPEVSTIDGAFMEADPEYLLTLESTLQSAVAHCQGIEDTVEREVGAGNSVELKPLLTELRHAERIVTDFVNRRGLHDAPAGDDEEGGDESGEGGGRGKSGGGPARLSGDITSREDVARALDKICEYYARYEPSSPLPLLLLRAKRLASLSFIEILKDIAPKGVDQALAIGGVSESDDE